MAGRERGEGRGRCPCFWRSLLWLMVACFYSEYTLAHPFHEPRTPRGVSHTDKNGSLAEADEMESSKLASPVESLTPVAPSRTAVTSPPLSTSILNTLPQQDNPISPVTSTSPRPHLSSSIEHIQQLNSSTTLPPIPDTSTYMPDPHTTLATHPSPPPASDPFPKPSSTSQSPDITTISTPDTPSILPQSGQSPSITTSTVTTNPTPSQVLSQTTHVSTDSTSMVLNKETTIIVASPTITTTTTTTGGDITSSAPIITTNIQLTTGKTASIKPQTTAGVMVTKEAGTNGGKAATTTTSTSDEQVVVTTTDSPTTSTAATTSRSTKTSSTIRSTTTPLIIVTEPPLNTTDLLQEYWVKTVIEEDPLIDVSNISYVSHMERKLSEIYDEGFQRLSKQNKPRDKRATTTGDTTLQMVNSTREPSGSRTVNLVYFMERYGNITQALLAVSAMETFDLQEITLRLGVIVKTAAQVYAPPVVPPPHDLRLWLIGAVLGGIVGAILFIWCVLFMYCKCTQPAKQRQRTPRTPRSTRISMTGDYDTNSYRGKMQKIQGFDIARTEVGLESEIQRDLKHKPLEPYRRRPDGSTELEGMYSAGDTPPPKPGMGNYTNTPPSKVRESGEGEEVTPVVTSLNMNKSRSQIPIDASLRRSLPPRTESSDTLHPPKKRSSSRRKKTESEESESEEEVSEDRKPLSSDWQENKERRPKKKSSRSKQEDKPRSKSKKKHRKPDEAGDDETGIYENIGKVSRGDPSLPEKLRSTQHAIRLPPLITTPLVGEALTNTFREETELQESLQQKADIERWRNKQRQRERTKGSKSSRSHPEGNPGRPRRSYRDAERQIAAVLGDPESIKQMPQVFKRKKKRRKSKSGVVNQNIEDVDHSGKSIVDPADPQYSSKEDPAETRRSRSPGGGGETETSGDDSCLEEVNEPTLEEARQRMHDLVDNAFAVISPRYSSQELVARPTEEVGPRHTPMYITPMKRTTSESGQVVWSPYNAIDEIAKVTSHQPLLQSRRRSSDRSDGSLIKQAPSPNTSFGQSNPAFNHDSDGEHSGKTTLQSDHTDPVRLGSQHLANTSLSNHTNTTNSSGADSGYVMRTPRDLRKALHQDDYTSVYMDSSHLNPKATRSHSPPERDNPHSPREEQDISDYVSRTNKENTRHLTQADFTPRSPRGSESGLVPDNKTDSFSQSKGPFTMLSEQTSLQLPSSQVLNTSSSEKMKQPTEIRLKQLDPVIPRLSEEGEVDELDVIRRASRRLPVSAQSNRSLRSELERLANHSPADTTITTAMV